MFGTTILPSFSMPFGRDFAQLVREIAGSIDAEHKPQISDDAYQPSTFTYEDGEGETVVIDLPGCPKESLDVERKGQYIKVEAKRTINGKEYKYATYFATKLDIENAKYAYADGVLTVKIPKVKKPEDEVKKISIE